MAQPNRSLQGDLLDEVPAWALAAARPIPLPFMKSHMPTGDPLVDVIVFRLDFMKGQAPRDIVMAAGTWFELMVQGNPDMPDIASTFAEVTVDEEYKGTFGVVPTEEQFHAWKYSIQEQVRHIESKLAKGKAKYVVVYGTGFLPAFTFLAAELMYMGYGGAQLYCINFPFNAVLMGCDPVLTELGPHHVDDPATTCTVTTHQEKGTEGEDPVIFIANNTAHFPLLSPPHGDVHTIRVRDGDAMNAMMNSRAVKMVRDAFLAVGSKLGADPTVKQIRLQCACSDAVALGIGQLVIPSLFGASTDSDEPGRIVMGVRGGPKMAYLDLKRVVGPPAAGPE